MTQEQLSRPVYVVHDLRIKKTTYSNYLRDYFADEVTSPRGIEPRLWIWEVDEVFELREWRGSASIVIGRFESEEDAELERYSTWDYNCMNGSYNAPAIAFTHDEAIKLIADARDKNPDVIRRYLAFQALADEAQKLHRQLIDAQSERWRLAIAAEAEEIAPDEQLLQEIQAAKKLASNEEKTKALAAAQVAFLHRIGHFPIRTDFWRVFKIVNKKSLQYV